MANYNQARAQVMIIVKPRKVAAVKVKAVKKKMIVCWKKDKKATGYQTTYAQNKKFTKAKKHAIINQNKTAKKVIAKIKPRKRIL